jgi:hypothetical protein
MLIATILFVAGADGARLVRTRLALAFLRGVEENDEEVQQDEYGNKPEATW